MNIYNLEDVSVIFPSIDKWIKTNGQDVTKLRHGVFPIGYVQNLFDRLEHAEEELASRSDLSDD